MSWAQNNNRQLKTKWTQRYTIKSKFWKWSTQKLSCNRRLHAELRGGKMALTALLNPAMALQMIRSDPCIVTKNHFACLWLCSPKTTVLQRWMHLSKFAKIQRKGEAGRSAACHMSLCRCLGQEERNELQLELLQLLGAQRCRKAMLVYTR